MCASVVKRIKTTWFLRLWLNCTRGGDTCSPGCVQGVSKQKRISSSNLSHTASTRNTTEKPLEAFNIDTRCGPPQRPLYRNGQYDEQGRWVAPMAKLFRQSLPCPVSWKLLRLRIPNPSPPLLSVSSIDLIFQRFILQYSVSWRVIIFFSLLLLIVDLAPDRSRRGAVPSDHRIIMAIQIQ